MIQGLKPKKKFDEVITPYHPQVTDQVELANR